MVVVGRYWAKIEGLTCIWGRIVLFQSLATWCVVFKFYAKVQYWSDEWNMAEADACLNQDSDVNDGE